MHTGREGMAAMPYFDDFDLGTVDILLISQYVPRFPLLLRFRHQWQSGECLNSQREGEQDLRWHQYLVALIALGLLLMSLLYHRLRQYNPVQPVRYHL